MHTHINIYIYIYVYTYIHVHIHIHICSITLFTLLDLRVSSLRSGHANPLCTVPTLTDDPRRESEFVCAFDLEAPFPFRGAQLYPSASP